MELSRVRMLRGPNFWTKNTAIEALIVCEESESRLESPQIFLEPLRSYFSDISVETQDLFLSLAHVLGFVAFRLQSCVVSHLVDNHTECVAKNTFKVMIQCSDEAVGRTAVRLAYDFCMACTQGIVFDLSKAVETLQETLEDVALGVSTQAIADAATARQIPYMRLSPNSSILQLGWGRRQRRIQAAGTDATSAIAEGIAQDKDLTRRLLSAAGIPTPEGYVVRDLEDAWDAACDIGLPVVVKPQNGNQGKCVTVNIETREQLEKAYLAAVEDWDDIMVESYLPGQSYRLLVIGQRMVAAACCEPPKVIGDGIHRIDQLVAMINQDPRRGEGHGTTLTKIRLDAISVAYLASQACVPESIPPVGKIVYLRSNANLSTGGTATDVTAQVHPAIQQSVVQAAKVIGLDICGVDVICQDITRPLEEQGGGIVEVNAAPGLRMHLFPSSGDSQPVAKYLIEEMFEEQNHGRIPIVAVTGTNGKTTTVRLIAHLLKQTDQCVGMTNTSGIYIDERRIQKGDCSGPRSARNLLLNPYVDMAVFETARGGILREGLGFDHCDVAVVTNIGQADHLGIDYIDTTEQLAQVKIVVVKNVLPQGVAVLNADDPLVASMAPDDRSKIIFFAMKSCNEILMSHRQSGYRVIYREGQHLVAVQGREVYQIALTDIPLTHGGLIDFQIENAMAAIAAVWGLQLDWALITQGLHSFGNGTQISTGRFNCFDYNNSTLIADYGHNADAFGALLKTLEKIPAKRRLVVMSGTGDRRDEDILGLTAMLAEHIDLIFLFQDKCQRGRDDGEVLALLRQGLACATRINLMGEYHGERTAIDAALNHVQPGDVCLILMESVDDTLTYLNQIGTNRAHVG